MSKEIVPQFYYPKGKPLHPDSVKEHNEAMDKVFGKGPGPGKSLAREEFEPVTTEIF